DADFQLVDNIALGNARTFPCRLRTQTRSNCQEHNTQSEEHPAERGFNQWRAKLHRSFAPPMAESLIAGWHWWLRATRPRTLPLSFFPTAIGLAWAWRDGAFNCATASVTLLCAVLLQVLANY